MNRLLTSVASLAVAICSFVPSAHATPITYEISSVASGKIGTKTFSNAEVDLFGIGDTTGVTSVFAGEAFANKLDTFTVTIAGIGTATVLDPSEILAVPGPLLPTGLTDPAILFGRTDHPPALDSITGIGIVSSPALAGYIGTTPIGPFTAAGGIGFNPLCGTLGHDPCVDTTLGFLSFTANVTLPPTGEASFVAAPVPEPTTLTLTALGLAGIVRRYRRRRAGR